MRYLTSTNSRLIAIIVFVLGLVSVGLSYSLKSQRAVSSKTRHARGFTIITKETITLEPQLQARLNQADYVITTRYRKSDGTWKEVKTTYKSTGQVLKDEMSFGVPGRGVFHVDKNKGTLVFLSSMPAKDTISYVQLTYGHENPRFLRDEVVQGYQTYVLHDVVGNDGSYEDDYFAPELDDELIKSVKVAPYGGSVTEAINIQLGEPDERVFESLPSGTVDYDEFNKKIHLMEERGAHETAESLREDMKQQKGRDVGRP